MIAEPARVPLSELLGMERGAARTREYARLYMRTYRAEKRANITPSVARLKARNVHPRLTPAPRVFVPLPPHEQKHGHCTFCGLRSHQTVCGFCQREIAA